ncbi:MAG: NAD-dependent epimerase/dehydratase family protein [bacterium]
MKIIIIGGTRFIGPSVVKKLHEQGHTILLFHRGKSKANLPEDIPHILGDRNNLADFRNEFAEVKPELVLDMAPITEKHAQTVVNVFRGITERVVAISSQDVYQAYGLLLGIEKGDVQPTPTDEDGVLRTKFFPYRQDKPRPDDDPRKILDDYDKILVERVIMSDEELEGTVLRLPMVYGPLDYQHRLYSYVKRMADNRPVIIMEKSMADWRSSVGYVENVADAIILAISDPQARNRIYNVAEPDNLSQAEWVEKIGEVFGWHGKVVVLPKEQLPEKMHADFRAEQDLTVDTARIRDELGYKEIVPTHEAIKTTIKWELENPPANIDPDAYDYKTEDEILRGVSEWRG